MPTLTVLHQTDALTFSQYTKLRSERGYVTRARVTKAKTKKEVNTNFGSTSVDTVYEECVYNLREFLILIRVRDRTPDLLTFSLKSVPANRLFFLYRCASRRQT